MSGLDKRTAQSPRQEREVQEGWPKHQDYNAKTAGDVRGFGRKARVQKERILVSLSERATGRRREKQRRR